MYYPLAQQEFESYLNGYDRENDRIKLKIIHTYGVVKQAEELAGRMHLSAEDTDLARLIALLHDIGRFEQLKRYDSFEPGTMDHAAYGVKVLFDEGMIRRFLPDDKWDSIIYTAIAHHSDYELPEISDPQTLLHAKLIRDEDKLDNCRVKLVDSTSTFINVSEEELGTQNITQKVYETVFKNKCILSADRVTQMDYWVSYIVYFFDINFKESFDIIAENDYLNRIIDRIPYSNPVTKEQMENIRVYMQNFINSNTNSQSFKLNQNTNHIKNQETDICAFRKTNSKIYLHLESVYIIFLFFYPPIVLFVLCGIIQSNLTERRCRYMIIKINMQSEVPIYLQLRNEIVKGIGRGEFEPGESLPTVRQMATDLGINTMTVSKAYQLLKTEGFLETDRRKGTTICYPTSSAPQDNRFDEKLADELELLSAEAKFHGMTLTDFLEFCQRAFNEMEVTAK